MGFDRLGHGIRGDSLMNPVLVPLMSQLPAGVRLASREGICALENSLRDQQFDDMHTFTQEEGDAVFARTDRFADGVYARELLLPAGTIVVGKIHKFGHLNVITRGRCIVVTEFGVSELVAPHTFISEPGTKRVVAAVEDTVWTTFHGVDTDEYDDIDQIEKRIICKTFDDFDSHQLSLKLEN